MTAPISVQSILLDTNNAHKCNEDHDKVDKHPGNYHADYDDDDDNGGFTYRGLCHLETSALPPVQFNWSIRNVFVLYLYCICNVFVLYF